MKKKSFFISTAIDYPSTPPHLGHAYEKICADVIARFKRLKGFEVHFSTGTDEHGLKIQRSAEKAEKKPEEFVDLMSSKFKKLCDELNISYDDFIRTTEERHSEVVRLIFEKLYQRGDIYKGIYEGPYCTECETFYSEKELVDGKCPVHERKAEWIKQECYFFRMGKYREEILSHIKENPNFIRPESRRNEILSRLKEPLRDLCVSRTDFEWGVKLPIDERHVIFVWVDALSNYLTTIDYPTEKFRKFWPADLHLIGKDISWHHCVIWSSLLLSIGLPLPERIFVHGFVTYKGEKLSKSKGVVIDPIHLSEEYSADALRYFLIREIPFGEDGGFSEESLKKRLNTELADVFGNFVHRVLTFTQNHFGGKAAEGRINKKLEAEISGRMEKVERLLEELKVTQALEEVMAIAKRGNEYFQSSEPWESIKSNPQKAADCLLNCVNLVKVLCVALSPFMPSKCDGLTKQLNFKIGSWEQTKKFDIEPGHPIGKPSVLFAKVRTNPHSRPARAQVSIKDFEKLDIRMGEVKKAEKISGSEKLVKLELELAGERRTVVAGIAMHYSPEELVGKQVAVVTNLEPVKLMGIKSEGMLLAVEDERGIHLLTADKPVRPGAKVR